MRLAHVQQQGGEGHLVRVGVRVRARARFRARVRAWVRARVRARVRATLDEAAQDRRVDVASAQGHEHLRGAWAGGWAWAREWAWARGWAWG